MFLNRFNLLRLGVISIFCLPLTLYAQNSNNMFDNEVANPFSRNINNIELSDIDYSLFKAEFMYTNIMTFSNNCENNAPQVSNQILETGKRIFYEDRPELMQSLNQTQSLWEEVNTLTNDAGTLNEKEIDTLNMISALDLLRINRTDVSLESCQVFLRNIEDRTISDSFWNNYINQAIPVIKETSMQ